MESLQDTAARVLGPLLESQPLSAGKVRFVWQMVAGPALGRATRVEWTPARELRITAASEAWRRELVRARPLLAVRLKQMLGDGAVRTIVIVD